MGTPGASDLTLAPGAGHGDEGDASFQGPAQEHDQAQALPAQPKPTHAEKPTYAEKPTNAEKPANPEAVTCADAASSVIELKARTTKAKTAVVPAVNRETGGLVTAHPKPAKRLNAKERAKEKYAKNRTENRTESRTEDRTKPNTTAKAKSKARKSKAASTAA